MPARQQTIRETVAWSVALLSDAERRVFARFGAFAGGACVAAAERVSSDSHEYGMSALDSLSALVDASLLMAEPAQRDDPRLRMLETVREFAMDALLRSSRRMRSWVGTPSGTGGWAMQSEPRLTGETQQDALTTLARDHANLGAALDWMIRRDHAEGALALAAALWRYWLVRGHFEEGRVWLARVLEMPASRAPDLDRLRADVMTGAGALAQNNGAVAAAKEYFEAVLAIRRAHHDAAGIARALADLGWIAWRQCDFPRARQLSSECLMRAEEVGATRVAALALTNLGATALFEGNFQRGVRGLGTEFGDAPTGGRSTGCGVLRHVSRVGAVPDGSDVGRDRASRARRTNARRRRRSPADLFRARDQSARIPATWACRACRGVSRDRRPSSIRRSWVGRRAWSSARELGVTTARTQRTAGGVRQGESCAAPRRYWYGEAESLALLAAAASANGDEATSLTLLQQSRGIPAGHR